MHGRWYALKHTTLSHPPVNKLRITYIDIIHRHMQYYFLREFYYGALVHEYQVYKLLNLFGCVDV